MSQQFLLTGFWGLFVRSEGHPWPVPRSSLALVTDKQSPKPSPGLHPEILKQGIRQTVQVLPRHAVSRGIVRYQVTGMCLREMKNG